MRTGDGARKEGEKEQKKPHTHTQTHTTHEVHVGATFEFTTAARAVVRLVYYHARIFR